MGPHEVGWCWDWFGVSLGEFGWGGVRLDGGRCDGNLVS